MPSSSNGNGLIVGNVTCLWEIILPCCGYPAQEIEQSISNYGPDSGTWKNKLTCGHCKETFDVYKLAPDA